MISKYPKCLALLLVVGVSSSLVSSSALAAKATTKLSKVNTHRAQDLINQLKVLALDVDSMIISEFLSEEILKSYEVKLSQADAIIAELQFYDEDPSVNLTGFSPNKHLAVISKKRSMIQAIQPLQVSNDKAELAKQIFEELEFLDEHRQLINYYHKKLNPKVKAFSDPNLVSRLQSYFFTTMLNEANDALNFLKDIEESQAKLGQMAEEFKKHNEAQAVSLISALSKNAQMIEVNKATFLLAKELAEEALKLKEDE